MNRNLLIWIIFYFGTVLESTKSAIATLGGFANPHQTPRNSMDLRLMEQERTMVNTESTPTGPTLADLRLSRLRHPRASGLALLLLAAVFLLFGLFANLNGTDYTARPALPAEQALGKLGEWVGGLQTPTQESEPIRRSGDHSGERPWIRW